MKKWAERLARPFSSGEGQGNGTARLFRAEKAAGLAIQPRASPHSKWWHHGSQPIM